MSRTRLVGIDLAGFRVAVEQPSGLPWGWPESGAPHPRAPTGTPDVYVGVRVGRCDARLSDPVRYALAGRRGAAVEVGSDGDDWVVAVQGPGGCERFARFDRQLRQGEVCVAPEVARARAFPLGYPLDEVLLLQRLAREGGLVVEGAAWPARSGATVLLGPASAGPPASPHPIAPCLRSPTAVLRIERGVVRVRGLREGTEGPEPCSLPLTSLQVTREGDFGGDRPQPEEAVDALLSHAVTPVHDSEAAERVLEVAARISRRVPLVRLALPELRPTLPLAWGQPAASMGFAPPVG